MPVDNQSLTITEKKLVYCVYELSLRGYAPSDSCLVQILKGNSCFNDFSDLACFGCLLSLRSRRAKSMVKRLVEMGMLRLSYSREEDEYYLFVTDEGLRSTKGYFASRPIIKKDRAGRKSPLIKII